MRNFCVCCKDESWLTIWSWFNTYKHTWLPTQSDT